MKQKEEQAILSAIEGKDVREVTTLVMRGSNRYSRRTLKFFRWFCKWAPVGMMAFHYCAMHGAIDARCDESAVYDAFVYFMAYVLPMVVIAASRFFYLCWKYRVPFFYLFGVNAIHVAYGSWRTAADMIVAHDCLAVMIVIIYAYGAADWFLNKTICGRMIFPS